ncbi:LysR family transcriptional regulator [Limobrevibacterium gyesilva]|uniref:LysR substrate-binding domain-containing protein n=1 Tax=Limobrevibacterium gyesilva TaxID=2991712 RepID=A0AA42CDG6_9PROT|nr:LysR family transcriptional regulator [Limobrevibacterium gyesilva]MCW3473824.1 LysR substrate-binding domain-containing protein [Limobrevibacterium gyesilva]
MDASDLRIFQAVARAGGMGRAAAVLNTVQSNVTTRIRMLEQELGAALFHRHHSGVTLTEAGRRLLPYAEQMAELLAQARLAVIDDGVARGALMIGSLETTAALRLPPILSAFTSAHPHVDLTLVTNTSACLITEVLEHRLDGAFVVGPVQHPALAEAAVFREELVLVTAPGVRDPADLSRQAGLKMIVFRAGCAYRQRLEAFLAMRGVVGVRPMEFGTLGGIIGCVGAGIGVTLLPRAVVAADAREGRVATHELPPAEARVETMFIRRADAHLSSAMAAFLDAARPAPMRLAG